METKFNLHEEVYCVYCDEIYKADVLSINIDAVNENYEIRLVNYSSESTKIIEYEKDRIFSTKGEIISALIKKQEKYIYNIKSNFVKRYKESI